MSEPWLFGRLQSPQKDSWETPPDLYAQLDAEFHFTHDAASEPHNRKGPQGFVDGLAEPWPDGSRVFCNPPYSECGEWAKKAAYETASGRCIAVLLIPAWTDRAWFHDYVLGAAEIRFIRGRVKYLDRDNVRRGRPPFPSILCVFGKIYLAPQGERE